MAEEISELSDEAETEVESDDTDSGSDEAESEVADSGHIDWWNGDDTLSFW